jgi:hypothetical protein
MITVSIKRELNVTSEKLWNLLSDFGHSLSPNIQVTWHLFWGLKCSVMAGYNGDVRLERSQ